MWGIAKQKNHKRKDKTLTQRRKGNIQGWSFRPPKQKILHFKAGWKPALWFFLFFAPSRLCVKNYYIHCDFCGGAVFFYARSFGLVRREGIH